MAGTVSIFAFDIDDTLSISNGPISIETLERLHSQGHVVGLCGNWARLIQCVPHWHRFISFIGSFDMSKTSFLSQIKTYTPASRFIMIGNSGMDDVAAREAGWEFITESDFMTWLSEQGINNGPKPISL